jgi:hypothetical protein
MNPRSVIERIPSTGSGKLSRRAVLRTSASGLGILGLRALFTENALADDSRPSKLPHFEPKAKRIIVLFMHGGPSSIDTFDPKPRLVLDDGKPLPFKRLLTFGENGVQGLMKSPWTFRQYGQSGIPVSELFPHVASCVDDLCVIRSVVGDGVDHGAALLQFHTGTFSFKRPSMGAWLLYGLGTENRNLPGFVAIKPSFGHGGQNNWSSSFLPGECQGTAIGNSGMKSAEIAKAPIPYLTGDGLLPEHQRYELAMLQEMNRLHAEVRQRDPELEARIEAFELAFRMQAEAPEAFDVDRESEATKKLYGMDSDATRDFGWQCLLARRLAERGVRMVQCWHSYKWDQHSDLVRGHTQNAREVDLPIAGLLKDLKVRGLLKDTLVLWCGEFGRTPWAQKTPSGIEVGRDHNPYGYTIWMAGAGVRPGTIYGATDEFGYHAVEDRMHIHDLHATILHLMGLDHERLTYRYAGRSFRLTDVAGSVATKILA